MDDPMDDIDRQEESEEEAYDENADEDFNPEAAEVEAEQSSSDEEPEEKDTTKKGKRPKKRKADADGEVLNAELDSGDEATIQERKRKKRRKEEEDAAAARDEDSGGEGGFIRTRAQRIVEKEERKNRKRARDGQVTINVEQVWKDLSSAPIGRATIAAPPPETTDVDEDADGNKENVQDEGDPNELITIKRRIEFAGEITEVEEKHPRGSKEAQKYLAEHPEADPKHPKHTANLDPSGLQRPLKRPSIFEPNPAGNVKGVAPEKLRRHAPTKTEGLMSQKLAEMKKNAQKMSTVQKSQLDWKGFVDKEGLRDELDEYGKSKRGFLAREAFLDRAAGAREQAARDARSRL
ncbi:hypothetical protein M409DRAFT_21627 [Zasmidium cellare ATCC 36951]|uniref:SWR1-complex protein 5 n=1 Tax=Zasmidium cellare ATCC 36951 TaxID=1080233 RepID=A0A6A6CNH3_ZASCE|nr:uncharacterized protein M409DRAFT_21627 [Zasmidium cellare ATCC 36951]KAF2168183.1 hypothetical protein M409DRAFT_21627 [Zasmidium cellare ATCC 36951]